MLRSSLIRKAREGRARAEDAAAGALDTGVPSRLETEEVLLGAFRADTKTHQMLAARFGGRPDEGVLRRVASILSRRPEWIRAEVLPGDALFLYNLVLLVRPRCVLEIGTASGFSGAFILAAIADSGAPLTDGEGRPALETFDICERCFWDESYEIGAAIAEVAPEHARGVRFHRGKVAADAPAALAGRRFPFAYIDASHRHPWPLADAMMLAPLLAPGAWLCLNDIALVEVGLHHRLEGVDEAASSGFARGPQLLFEHWPWLKVRGLGLCSNMGAVQVPDPSALTPAAFGDLLRYPWDGKPSEAVSALLGPRPKYPWRPGAVPDARAQPAPGTMPPHAHRGPQ